MHQIYQTNPFGSYALEQLLTVGTAPPPKDYDDFWQSAYDAVLGIDPKAEFRDTEKVHQHWRVYDLAFQSTQGMTIGGWMLVPAHGEPSRAFVVGHGYGGRDGPDFHLPFADAALFFPCCRGISRSAVAPISSDPYWHVIHDIDKKDQYILRGCVEDIWLTVSVIEQKFPALIGKIGYLGISFSGGVGVMALSRDTRIARAHFNVPTFGNHRLRLRIPTMGSGLSVQDFYRRDPHTLIRTLRYYDAANAAARIKVPVHFALALRDQVVTPPGQFAIYNQVNSEKHLYVLEAGHDSYPTQEQQNKELLAELSHFFSQI